MTLTKGYSWVAKWDELSRFGWNSRCFKMFRCLMVFQPGCSKHLWWFYQSSPRFFSYFYVGFHKWGYPNSWMVGKSQSKMDDLGVLHLWKTPYLPHIAWSILGVGSHLGEVSPGLSPVWEAECNSWRTLQQWAWKVKCEVSKMIYDIVYIYIHIYVYVYIYMCVYHYLHIYNIVLHNHLWRERERSLHLVMSSLMTICWG